MVPRILSKVILERLSFNKAIIINGARQVGKTTLVQSIAQNHFSSHLYLNGDEPDTLYKLDNISTEQLARLVSNRDLVIFDEAQRIPNVGLVLKRIIDRYPEKSVLAIGSSSFELNRQIQEHLTGRKFEYYLFPFSTSELIEHLGYPEERQNLERRIIYGNYPDIVLNESHSEELLHNLTHSYLFKDILALQDIRKPELLDRLIQALAYQLGNQVSYNELSRTVKADKETIERYINLLEKCFVIFRLPSFSKILGNELKKSRKIYFYDLGIRNAVISDFRWLDQRQDVGALWENYLIAERIKATTYQRKNIRRYFWRTTQQQEIDYIEQHDTTLKAFEFKWNSKAKGKFSKTFTRTYPRAETKLITPQNYLEFIDI